MGNREKLLEAATAMFGQVGYQAASVDDILEASSVSPSNFYYHFRSKEELALEVLEGYFDKSRQRIAPLFMNKKLSDSAKLEQLHQTFVKKMTENGCCGGCPLGNLAQELSDTHPDFRRRLADFFEECMEGIAAVVRHGVRSGEFRRDVDPEAAAYLLLGAIEGLVLLSKNMKTTAPLEKGFRLALNLMKI
jgi:TetR/AcrR family transcriptional regulator, transcriptional repressor for nem operon